MVISVGFYIENHFKIQNQVLNANFVNKNSETEILLSDHMKLLHIQFVPKCKSEGDCKFYSRKCWFVHQEDIEIAYLNAKNRSQSENILHDME